MLYGICTLVLTIQNPTQKTWTCSYILRTSHADFTTPTQQHKLDHTGQESICPAEIHIMKWE